MKKKTIDDLDIAIIKKLEEDARRSYREIANELGISVGTVHNRIKKMEKNEVLLGFFPLLNSQKFGYNLTFIVQVSIRGGDYQKVFDKLKAQPFVKAIYWVTGEVSAILVCNFKNINETRDFIFELNQMVNVEKTVSSLVLERVKEDLSFHLVDEEGKSG
ncbi:MAG: Lrp/AsnC family transcriptional regulator [Promethearchaeota archaeon]